MSSIAGSDQPAAKKQKTYMDEADGPVEDKTTRPLVRSSEPPALTQTMSILLGPTLKVPGNIGTMSPR